VTIRFVDVVESTRLTRHRRRAPALHAIVESQHGRVFQYAGDGLLAMVVARIEAAVGEGVEPRPPDLMSA
jgi:class 3 adenylate cyclase